MVVLKQLVLLMIGLIESVSIITYFLAIHRNRNISSAIVCPLFLIKKVRLHVVLKFWVYFSKLCWEKRKIVLGICVKMKICLEELFLEVENVRDVFSYVLE